MDEEEDTSSDCPICFETFQEIGDHVSRLLPCGGIICESCITDLIDSDSIDCPECGSKHTAEKGVETFPQNNTQSQSFDVSVESTASSQSSELPRDEEACKEHGKHPSIYCQEPYCKKAVLQLQSQHTDVASVAENLLESLIASLEAVLELLNSVKIKIVTGQKEVEAKNQKCLERLKAKREEMIRVIPREEDVINLLNNRFDELTEGATSQRTKLNPNIGDEVAAIDEHIALLTSIKESVFSPSASQEEIRSNLERVKSIETQIQSNLATFITLKYLEYSEKPSTTECLARLCSNLKGKDFCEKLSIAEDVESLCGFLRQRETCVHLTTEPAAAASATDDDDDDDLIVVDVQLAKRPTEERPAQEAVAKPSGFATVSINCSDVRFMISLTDGTVVICGKDAESNRWKLKRFDVQMSKEISSADLDNKLPSGVSEMTLEGKQCIALSYLKRKEIWFYEVDNLERTLRKHSVSPYKPLLMCELSPSTLYYVDCSKIMREVRWFHCVESKFRESKVFYIRTNQDNVRDLCTFRFNTYKLVITCHGSQGFRAFDAATGAMKWMVESKLSGMAKKMVADGITADEEGHLYVCDSGNKCIQMFSMRTYLRSVSGQVWDVPLKVRWCLKTSTLNVVNINNGKLSISKVPVPSGRSGTAQGVQVKREATEDSTETVPAKRSRWDVTTREQQGDTTSAQQRASSGSLGDTPRSNASEFTCKVTQNIPTDYSSILRVCPVSSNIVVVCGEVRGRWKLDCCDLKSGVGVWSTTLFSKPDAMTTVVLNRRHCVALSYTDQRRIEFHEVDKLDEVVVSKNVSPHRPGHLCTASPTLLVYEDLSGSPRQIRWLDCTDIPIRPLAMENVADTRHGMIWDMCHVPGVLGQLLVMACDNSGLFAYGVRRGQAGWSVRGKLGDMEHDMNVVEVATDKRGHLYVCDISNACIQMFTTAGKYMGPLLKGNQGIAQPWKVCWSDSSSSLVVVLIKNRQYQISVVKVSNVIQLRSLNAQPTVTPLTLGDVNTGPTIAPLESVPTAAVEERMDVDVPGMVNVQAGSGTGELSAIAEALPPTVPVPLMALTTAPTVPTSTAPLPIVPQPAETATVASVQHEAREVEDIEETSPPETAERYTCKATMEINSRCKNITLMTPAGDDSVVICGMRGVEWKLLKFNVQTGAQLISASLATQPDGLQHVEMGGNPCLAVSYVELKMIEFRDATKIKKVLLSLPLSFRPSLMCTTLTSLSTLLCLDQGSSPQVVRWLYCSTSPTLGSYKTKTQQQEVQDMCCVEHENKRLLVTTQNLHLGVRAYYTATATLEWQAKGRLDGMEKEMEAGAMATDGRGHLFVVDSANACVQMFTTAGRYMGALLQNAGIPSGSQWRIRWCRGISSLVVASMKNQNYQIKVFKVSDSEGTVVETPSDNVAEPAPVPHINPPDVDLTTKDKVSDFNWKVVRSSRTTCSHVSYMSPVGDNSVVVCGKQSEQWNLTLYDLQDGTELDSAVLNEMPWGLADVILNGYLCVAVSSMNSGQIDFHDVNNLSSIRHSHNVSPHTPSRLCTSPPSLLIYEDISRCPRQLVWLDCSEATPKTAAGPHVTSIQQSQVWDMCCVKNDDVQLLVTTRGFGGGIYAYDMQENELMWNVEGKLRGMEQNFRPLSVTTDGQRYVFVCDSENKCLQMFSLDGKYMGALLKEGEQGLSKLWGIRWSTSGSALIGLHVKDNQYIITEIKGVEGTETPREKQPEQMVAPQVPGVTPRIEFQRADAAVPTPTQVAAPPTEVLTSQVQVATFVREVQTHHAEVEEGEITSEDDVETPTEAATTVDIASELSYQVLSTITTKHRSITQMTALSDGCVVVCDREKLARHSFLDERKPQMTELYTEPCGMAEVTFNGKQCLAISFVNRQYIVFYDVNDSRTVLSIHSTEPHKPGYLTTASPSVLLYVNYYSHLYDVRWLDCSTSTVKPVAGCHVTHTEQSDMRDMCCAYHKSKLLLIATYGDKGIFAYRTSKDCLYWNVHGQMPGMRKNLSAQKVAADIHGNVVICDDNNDCLQMFSTEGTYLGAVQRLGERIVDSPISIRWCLKTSFFTLASMSNATYSIRKIEIRSYTKAAQGYTHTIEGTATPVRESTEREMVVDLTVPEEYKVVPVTVTEHRHLSYLLPLGGNDIVVCSTEQGRSKLTKYNLQTGAQYSSTALDKRPDGMAVVMSGGMQCLAISYTNKKVILFFNVNSMSEIVHVYSTAPSKPGRLCTASPSVLLFEDRSKFPCVVKWLDCRTSPPKAVSGTNITHTQQASADDLCCVQRGTTTLLIITRSLDGLFAYNTQTDRLEWKIEGQIGSMENRLTPESVTTDGGVGLYVGDWANSCIQMFDLDGMHIKSIMKAENQTSKQPPRVSWCNSMSSLLVAQVKDQQYHISMVQNIRGFGTHQVSVEEDDEAEDSEDEVAEMTTEGTTEPQLQPTTSAVEYTKTVIQDSREEKLISPPFSAAAMQDGTLITEYSQLPHICPLPNDTFLVCGKTGDNWILTQYVRHSGQRLAALVPEEEPTGLALVTVTGRYCVALSYKNSKEILFYDALDISKLMVRHQVAPDEPGRLCTVNPTVLLYEDQSQKPRQIKWLDCTCYPQVPTSGMRVNYTRHANLVDICFICYEGRNLLVTARGFHGLDAYNSLNSKLEWSVIGKLPGMTKGICAWSLTTDGSGCIYVADKLNSCIQVFLGNGKHIKAIQRDDFGQMFAVRWWDLVRSLLCVHKKDGKFFVDVGEDTSEGTAEEVMQPEHAGEAATGESTEDVETEKELTEIETSQETRIEPSIAAIQTATETSQNVEAGNDLTSAAVTMETAAEQNVSGAQKIQKDIPEQGSEEEVMETKPQATESSKVPDLDFSQEFESDVGLSDEDDFEAWDEAPEEETEVNVPSDLTPARKSTSGELTEKPSGSDSTAADELRMKLTMMSDDQEAEVTSGGNSRSEGRVQDGVRTQMEHLQHDEPTVATVTQCLPESNSTFKGSSQRETDFILVESGDVSSLATRADDAIALNYTVSLIGSVEYSDISFMRNLDGSSVVVCGTLQGQSKLAVHNARDFTMVNSTILKNAPWGMTVVTLAGRLCVALSYTNLQKIDFHNASNLEEVVLSYTVSEQPGRLCTMSPSVLLYVDQGVSPSEVQWLDCSTSPPKPLDTSTGTQQNQIWDMCCIQEQNLLIASRAADGIYAYNTDQGEVLWTVRGRPSGMNHDFSAEAIATDGRGSLFACDSNNACLQVCSVDGQYLGALLREHEQDVVKPWRITWCNSISSLIVAHTRGRQYHISLVSDTPNQESAKEPEFEPPRSEDDDTRQRDVSETEKQSSAESTEECDSADAAGESLWQTPASHATEAVCDEIVQDHSATSGAPDEVCMEVEPAETSETRNQDDVEIESDKQASEYTAKVERDEETNGDDVITESEHPVQIGSAETSEATNQVNTEEGHVHPMSVSPALEPLPPEDVEKNPGSVASVEEAAPEQNIETELLEQLSVPQPGEFVKETETEDHEMIQAEDVSKDYSTMISMEPVQGGVEKESDGQLSSSHGEQAEQYELVERANILRETRIETSKPQNEVYGEKEQSAIPCVEKMEPIRAEESSQVTPATSDQVCAEEVRSGESPVHLVGKSRNDGKIQPEGQEVLSTVEEIPQGSEAQEELVHEMLSFLRRKVEAMKQGEAGKEETQATAPDTVVIQGETQTATPDAIAIGGETRTVTSSAMVIEGETQSATPDAIVIEPLYENVSDADMSFTDENKKADKEKSRTPKNVTGKRKEPSNKSSDERRGQGKKVTKEHSSNKKSKKEKGERSEEAAESAEATSSAKKSKKSETEKSDTVEEAKSSSTKKSKKAKTGKAEAEEDNSSAKKTKKTGKSKEVTEEAIEISSSKKSKKAKTAKEHAETTKEVSEAKKLKEGKTGKSKEKATKDVSSATKFKKSKTGKAEEAKEAAREKTGRKKKATKATEKAPSKDADMSYEDISDSEFPDVEDTNDDVVILNSPRAKNKSVQNSVKYDASLDRFKVDTMVETKNHNVAYVASLADSSVVICGKEEGCELWKLTKYKMPEFSKINSTLLEKRPHGMAEIALGTKHCVAVSYLDSRKIDFHDANDMREIVLSHTVRHLPGRLCTASPTVLLYEDRTRIPCEVRWLNCGGLPPKPVTGKNITFTEQGMIWDMCCVKHKDKQLLVTTRGYHGLVAYNVQTDKVEWSVKGKRSGKKREIGVEAITTDGQGHLFVCGHRNASIWMFLACGRYRGTVLRQRNQKVVEPWKVTWSEKESALIVAHAKDKLYSLTTIRDTSAPAKKEPEAASKDVSATDDIEQFFADLTEKNSNRTSSPVRQGSEEDDTSGENVSALELLRASIIQKLTQVPETDDDPEAEETGKTATHKTGSDLVATHKSGSDVAATHKTRSDIVTTHKTGSDIDVTHKTLGELENKTHVKSHTPAQSTAATSGIDSQVEVLNNTEKTRKTADAESAVSVEAKKPPWSKTEISVESSTAGTETGKLSSLTASRQPTVEGMSSGGPTQSTQNAATEPEGAPLTETHDPVIADATVKEVNIETGVRSQGDRSVVPEADSVSKATDGIAGKLTINVSAATLDSSDTPRPGPSITADNTVVEKASFVSVHGEESDNHPASTQSAETSDDSGTMVAYKVVQTMGTTYKHIAYMCPLEDDSAIVCGKQNKLWKLSRYNLGTGEEVNSTRLQKRPDGLAVVSLAGRSCVAASYMKVNKIDFRNINRLEEIVCSYICSFTFDESRPSRLCAGSSSSLFYVDQAKSPLEAKRIDCSTLPPKPSTDTSVTQLQQDIIWDMCCVRSGSHGLLVTTGGFDGVCAHDICSNKTEWSVKGQLTGMNEQITADGITADGCGQIFVSDENNKCIHMLSQQGAYKGIILKEGEQDLGRPRLIRWCSKTSSLIVAHIKSEHYSISKVQKVADESGTIEGGAPGPDSDGDGDSPHEDIPQKKTNSKASGSSNKTTSQKDAAVGKSSSENVKTTVSGCGNTNTIVRDSGTDNTENVRTEKTMADSVPENTETSPEGPAAPASREEVADKVESQVESLTRKNTPAHQSLADDTKSDKDKPRSDDTVMLEPADSSVAASEKQSSAPTKRKATTRDPADGIVIEDSPVVKKQKREETEPKRKKGMFHFHYRVPEMTVATKHCRISYMCMLSGNSMVVCSKDHDISPWKLTKYATKDFTLVESTTLKHIPDGLAAVTFDGRRCVAVSYIDQMRIEFHDAKKLKEVDYSHLVSSHRPGRLSSVPHSHSTLLYEDESVEPRVIRWLDCSTCPPTLKGPAADKNCTHTTQDIVLDMCCVRTDTDKLLVTSRGYEGLFAYSSKADKLVWNTKGKLAGMKETLCAESLTTDGRGHIFVCDTGNTCVQMFSPDGAYRGAVLRKRRQTLEQPLKIRWCKHSSSLIFAHVEDEHYAMSVIPVNADEVELLNEDEMQLDDVKDTHVKEKSFLVKTQGESTQFKFKVVSTKSIRQSVVSHLSTVAGGSVVISGKVNDQWKLKLYNLQYGGELCSVRLPNQPGGMATVTLDGKQCLALSYSDDKKILFHSVDSLTEVVASHSVAPHVPGPLLTSSPSVLLYQDISKYPVAVRWLDCNMLPPTAASGKNVMKTFQVQVSDMCYVEDEGKQLLVATRGLGGGIDGYNTNTDKLEWIKEGKLQAQGLRRNIYAEAVTTDGRGYLFVCDTANASIQMFSTEGTYLGCVMRVGEHGLGGPFRIRWCDSLSALAVVHVRDMHYHFSMIEAIAEQPGISAEKTTENPEIR